MGFNEKKVLQFSEPKVLAYRADVNELADYTLKLLTDDKLRLSMGEEARRHAVKNFDYRYTARQMTDIIKAKLKLS